MDPKNAIELKKISLSYTLNIENNDNKGLFKRGKTRTENQVLDNINLNIKKGEILGIVGTNGCGKSTFMNLPIEKSGAIIL